MASNFGWIDFSNEHRDRVFSVVDMLTESNAIDELGIGVVRDALADWLFPGVSTIQTRPKYFILIPILFLQYLKDYNQGKAPHLKKYLREKENELMHRLAKNANYKEGKGIIGVQMARNNGELARKASSIYWNGLRTHGIIKTNLSLSEYVKLNNLKGASSSESNLDDSLAQSWEQTFGLTIPTSLEISEDVDMELSLLEAQYLKDQFLTDMPHHKQSSNLLKFILKDTAEMEMMQEFSSFKTYGNYLISKGLQDNQLLGVIQTALAFDFLMHGAHIRYNILLQQKSGTRNFDEEWNNWVAEFKERSEGENIVDFDFLFNSIATRTKQPTRFFMIRWQEEMVKTNINLEALDDLVINQELAKKKSNAKINNPTAEVDDWIGIRQLDYRFKQGKEIVIDIMKGYARS
ncbi:DUF6361 family protein [Leeuwenhoekiella aequorea]|uniref:DUF6361 family protein n=1 Tax=Leeuwenhoekiella aequorea TaxID=283736 RepID=UPI00352E2D92|tara:strand:- start:22558 stop:23775 length:1218 start_codon:yes stop_codon:yes gene_type:complete